MSHTTGKSFHSVKTPRGKDPQRSKKRKKLSNYEDDECVLLRLTSMLN